MLSLSGDKDAEVMEAFNSTFRYLDAVLKIHNKPYSYHRYALNYG